MDSMVNHYTAGKRLRSTDAYTPGGVAGFRVPMGQVRMELQVSRRRRGKPPPREVKLGRRTGDGPRS